MFTNSTFLAGLRKGLTWVRARLATMPKPEAPALPKRVFALEACRLPVPVPIPIPRRGPRLGAFAVAVAAALAVAAPLPSAAWHAGDVEFTTDGRLVDVQVRVEGKGPAPLYVAPGRYDRRYFQAFKGRNYSLVVRNNTGRRIGVLIAVDGLNVINGERSALSRHEPMYVLDAYERAVIRGWRTSLDQVRRFVFVDEERSYAERTGQANGDMGWIRVLAFREQRPLWDDRGKIRGRDAEDEILPYGSAPELERPDRALPERRELQKSAPQTRSQESAPGSPEQSRLHGRLEDSGRESSPGTGWGQRQWDRVNRTWFVADTYPVDRITLRYEYASGLRALGIRIWGGPDRLWERERGQLGFAQPPRW